MRERYPRLEVSLVVGETDDLLPAVVARELDVALVDSWVTMPLRLPAGLTARS